MTDLASPATAEPPVLAGVLDTAARDESVRVQDDLFRHVNGSWLAAEQIPADRPGTGSFLVLRDAAEEDCHAILTELAHGVDPAGPPPTDSPGKIAALYVSFMDEARIEELGASPLEDELAPVLAASDKDALAQVIGAGAASGFHGPVAAAVEVDLNDPRRYTTWMEQSGLGLPDESYYREEDHAAVREAYVAHVARMLDLAGLAERMGAPAEELAQRVMSVETTLAAGHWDRVTCRDIKKTNNPMTWQDLTSSAAGFPWQRWRAGLQEAARAAQASIGTFLTEAIVRQPDFLEHMARAWQSADLEDLRAWAAWHVVHGRATLLSSEFVAENFSFYSRRLQGTAELRARWKRGVALVDGVLGEALGEIYVERHFPQSHKEAMEALVVDLIEAYRQSISSLDWMSLATRERALDKLALFTPKIGYPQRWRDYSDVEVVPGDVMASVRSAERYELARMLGKLGGPVDRGEWHMTPQTVNAYYNPTMNEIVFPAAILQPPFFDPAVDDAVNYAAIGAVIGHEIGHGFDDQGSTFDGHGRVTNWWQEADREAFTERTSALIAQYDAYRPAALVAAAEAAGEGPDKAPKVNGSLTIGENIGDLGGLGIALKAYAIALGRQGVESVADAPVVDGLTAMQRFFYSWARIWRGKQRDDFARLLLNIDPHSPVEFRCNGIVRNMDAFYEAFDVRQGDALWLDPEDRVSIW